MMKAIETRYNGHRFRSRTEARWAVLFDHLGVKYEYEPEGYELGSETRYLPDFYLPREDCYIEIKGAQPSKSELHRAGVLAYESGKWVDMLVGQPGQHQLIAFRGRAKPNPDLLAWLDQCPDERARWRAAGDLSKSQAIPMEYFDVPWISALVPHQDTRYRIFGLGDDWKREHLELDYVPSAGRLGVWRVSLMDHWSGDFVDERYGLIAQMRSYELHAWRVPIPFDADAAQHITDAQQVELSREFESAVEAARSARFEFGESGAG